MFENKNIGKMLRLVMLLEIQGKSGGTEKEAKSSFG